MSSDYNTPSFAEAYLQKAGEIPHRGEGEAALLESLPRRVERVLDLGCGDGRLLDASPTMLAAARRRFEGAARVTVVGHDLAGPLPDLGQFDAIVSAFAIHHLAPVRQRGLYGEIWAALRPGGVFANLEHVSSPTARLEEMFYNALGTTAANRDPSNQCVRLDEHLAWLNELGFEDADCLWKWRELALVAGVRPAS
jgi:tRNA (cmo5U34)-methyltransferase